MSLPDRLHWLKRLRHSRVKFLFSGGGYCESMVQGPRIVPVVGVSGEGDGEGDGGVREGKTLPFDGATVIMNNVKIQECVRELRVRDDICAFNKIAENKRRPFPKTLFPPPPERVEGDEDEESEEAKKKRLKDLKKSVRQELKRGLAGAKTDEVEWGNYDDEISEDEEEEEEEEEVSQRCGLNHYFLFPSPLLSYFTVTLLSKYTLLIKKLFYRILPLHVT